MLEIKIPKKQIFLEEIHEFVDVEPTVLKMEHSLLSVSAWEAKWKKPFLSEKKKTKEEMLDYIRCMTLNKDSINPIIYLCLSDKNMMDIINYIKDPMTATWFSETKGEKVAVNRRAVTAELIYCDMILLGIPKEMERWHLQRLITLIRVVSEESRPKKKMSRIEEARQRSAIMKARRAKNHGRG